MRIRRERVQVIALAATTLAGAALAVSLVAALLSVPPPADPAPNVELKEALPLDVRSDLDIASPLSTNLEFGSARSLSEPDLTPTGEPAPPFFTLDGVAPESALASTFPPLGSPEGPVDLERPGGYGNYQTLASYESSADGWNLWTPANHRFATTPGRARSASAASGGGGGGGSSGGGSGSPSGTPSSGERASRRFASEVGGDDPGALGSGGASAFAPPTPVVSIPSEVASVLTYGVGEHGLPGIDGSGQLVVGGSGSGGGGGGGGGGGQALVIDPQSVTMAQSNDVVPVPEPASLLLLGSGLAATVWRARRRAGKRPTRS